MNGTVTITATTGPAMTVTELILNKVTNIEQDLEGEIVRIKHEKGISEFSLVGVTGFVVTMDGLTGSEVGVVIS